MRIFFASLLVSTAFAASPVQVWLTADLKAGSDRLASSPDAKTIAGKTLGAFGNQSASLWRRATSGQAELHKTKIDLIVIEQGSATLLVGGTIADGHATQANEIRGSAIRNGEAHKLSPGDIVRVPANVPHQFILEPGQTVAYFALKIESK